MMRLAVEGIHDLSLVAAKRRAIFGERRSFRPALLVDEVALLNPLHDSDL